MGSLIPFQDLNLVPESATMTNTSTSTTPTATINLKIPKIEPKVEPLDEFYETQQALQTQEPQKTTLFPSPSLEALLNSQFSTVSSEENRTPLSQASSGISPEQDNLYSEYRRISELFRTAFAKRLQKCGDAGVSEPDSRAIVPVLKGNQNQVTPMVVAKRKTQRSKKLVRVTDLAVLD